MSRPTADARETWTEKTPQRCFSERPCILPKGGFTQLPRLKIHDRLPENKMRWTIGFIDAPSTEKLAHEGKRLPLKGTAKRFGSIFRAYGRLGLSSNRSRRLLCVAYDWTMGWWERIRRRAQITRPVA